MLSNLFSIFNNSKEEFKPSSELVDGRISYKFQSGIVTYQEELSLAQDEKLTAILIGFDVSSFSLENTSIKDLIEVLVKEKVLTKILDIILLSPEKQEYSQLKNSELQSVLSDFFSLNPTAINWLKTIGIGLTSLPPTQSTKSSSVQ